MIDNTNTEARMNYEIHPIANIFPPMSDAEFQALKADIEQYGQREPIWLFEGKVIDGRHRLRALLELSRAPLTELYDGFDAVAFVVSLNLHRRHLDESQRGMVAAKLETMEQGRPSKDANLHLYSPVTRAAAAEMLNVSTRTVAAASKVQAEADPEVVDAVERGKMSVSLAAKVVDLPVEDKAKVAAAAPDQIREVAREAVHNHRAQGTGENEWYTPADYVEAARDVLGTIDLDPASSDTAQQTVQAEKFFSIEDNGLEQPWEGKVWLNPPYAQPAIQNFVDRLSSAVESSRVPAAILLTHNYTDTRWFHTAAKNARAICFTRGRIGFISPEGKRAAPTQGQAFFYYGANPELFADVFCQFGLVVGVVRMQAIQELAEAA